MRNRNPLLKWSAVAGSVVLAALFIAYRAGAFNSRAEVPTPAVADEPSPGVSDPKILMSGSKSLAPVSFLPDQSTAPAAAGKPNGSGGTP